MERSTVVFVLSNTKIKRSEEQVMYGQIRRSLLSSYTFFVGQRHPFFRWWWLPPKR